MRMMTARAFLRSSVVVAVAVALAAAVGCGSSSDDENKANDKEAELAAAREYYVARVHPAANTCLGCHVAGGAPAFMAQDPQASYDLIEKTVGLIASPRNSPLVQYIHRDPSVIIGPEQRSVISQWLSFEATARGLAGAIAKPKSITDAYAQFAECMNYDVWTYYRMGDIAFAHTDSEGPCLGCHSAGQGSAWLSAGSRETFEKFRQFPYIQKMVVGRLDRKGSFESLAPSGRLIEKADEICPPESTSCHPRYGLPPAIIQAIKNFVDTTIQNQATGNCGGIVVAQPEAGAVDAGGGG